MSLFGGSASWGVDIGSQSMKAVQVARSRAGIRLLSASIYEYSGEGQLREGLQSLFGESLPKVRAAIQFTGKAFPVIRHLSIPIMPIRELVEAVRWEGRKLTSLPAEETVVDFLIMGKSQEHQVQQYDLLVVIVERAVLLEELKVVKEAGLQVAGVDVAPLALLRTLGIRRGEPPSRGLLYVDIGARKTEINILKGGVLRFTREVSMGGGGVTQALVQSLGLSPADAEQRKRSEGMGEGSPLRVSIQGEIDRVIVEIQRSIDYYRAQSREAGVDKIVVMGGTSLLPGFMEYFSGFFDAPVELNDPFSPMACSNPKVEALRGLAPRFSLAVGLALRR